MSKNAGEHLLTTDFNRVRHGNVFASGCPSREVMKHVTSSWGLLILIALQAGTLRFGQLRRQAGGVSERMLSQTLQWLVGDGLVLRRSYPVVPPHTDYTLTPLGREVAVKVADLARWIEERLPELSAEARESEADGGGHHVSRRGGVPSNN